MSDASQFPVTQGYGYDPSYQGNTQHFHQGIDYGAPEGTQIIVNGVLIGLVGHTGLVYDQNGQNTIKAAHLHVGRWVNGKSTNPGVGNGFKFNSAIVTEVSQDPADGKYVALNGDGARWVYLHMSDNSKVKVGQVLKGGQQGGDVPITQSQQDKLIKMGKQDEPRADELNNQAWANDPGLAIDAIWSGYGNNYYGHRVSKGDIENLLKDVGITPTQADYDTALGLAYTSPKDFAYWLQGKIKNAPQADSTTLKPGKYQVK